MTTMYRPAEAIALLRPALRAQRIPPSSRVPKAAFTTSRPSHATQSSTTSNPPPPPSPPRKQVTVVNDTGSVRWGELSVGEKAARTTQQSFNLVVVLVGVALTGAVGYLLFSDVFSPSSKTAHFNRATTRVRQSAECVKLLGPSSQISAHGEASWSRWARNRFIASTHETDKWGTEHLRFKFYVEGPLNQGVVHVHLSKRPSQSDFEYVMLAVDVKGHQRVWLENADEKKNSRVAPKIFGARWW
ncbi:TIM21-domain-containing protein, partial [Lophiostoma macrostomum CBS 122681]